MTTYRRRPDIVEAFQLTDDNVATPEAWPEWLRQANALEWTTVGAVFPAMGSNFLYVRTALGTFSAYVGSWIVRADDGEILAPLSAADFEQRYEPLPGQEPYIVDLDTAIAHHRGADLRSLSE